jgi:hypothetical protein
MRTVAGAAFNRLRRVVVFFMMLLTGLAYYSRVQVTDLVPGG